MEGSHFSVDWPPAERVLHVMRGGGGVTYRPSGLNSADRTQLRWPVSAHLKRPPGRLHTWEEKTTTTTRIP